MDDRKTQKSADSGASGTGSEKKSIGAAGTHGGKRPAPHGSSFHKSGKPGAGKQASAGRTGKRPDHKPFGASGHTGRKPGAGKPAFAGHAGRRPEGKPSGAAGRAGGKPRNKPNGAQTPAARAVALHTLLRCRPECPDWGRELSDALERERVPALNRPLVTELVYGVLERRVTLDWYIAAFSHTSPEKLHPVVREALHLGMYQLLYMKKIPESAAVNESVELVKAEVPQLAGFTNGVLRAFIRGLADVRMPEPEDAPDALSVRYSVSLSVAQAYLDAYGPELAEKALAASFHTGGVSVVVNTAQIAAADFESGLSAAGVSFVRTPAEGCLHLSGAGKVTELFGYDAGYFYVQDCASWYCVLAADAQPGDKVLDLCAAPGGKTLGCAVRMQGQGQIVAADLHEKKVNAIKTSANRLKFGIINACVNDARTFCPEWEGAFDLVLCDVPCSGIGTLSKKPEIRYKDMADCAGLPAIQRSIVECAAQYVRPGGVLLYSTCTVPRAENEDVVDGFLAGHPEFFAENAWEYLPEAVARGEGNYIRLDSARYAADGFFTARLRKKG